MLSEHKMLPKRKKKCQKKKGTKKEEEEEEDKHKQAIHCVFNKFNTVNIKSDLRDRSHIDKQTLIWRAR